MIIMNTLGIFKKSDYENRTSEDMRIDHSVYHFPFFQNVVTEKFFATLILDSNNKTDDNIITLNNLYPLYEVHLNLVINDDAVTCDTCLFNTYFIISNREKYLGNGNSDLNIFLNVNYIGDNKIQSR